MWLFITKTLIKGNLILTLACCLAWRKMKLPIDIYISHRRVTFSLKLPSAFNAIKIQNLRKRQATMNRGAGSRETGGAP